MSNTYIAEYRNYIKRTRGTDDPRPDWQLTLELGDMLRQSGEFDSIKEKYPDFRTEYLEFKADNGRGVMGEIGSGFGRAARGLGATALGTAALGLDAVGADDTARSLVQKGKELEQGGDNAPAVESMDDITGIGSAVKYAAGKVGEAAPSLIESVGTGLAGAALGTAAEPGPGTAAGGIAGMIGKQAVKNLLKREVAKRILTEAGEELTEAGVRNALTKGLKGVAEKELKDALAAEATNVAKTWGTNAAIAANSYGLSAGEIYNATENPALALGAGAIAAVPDTILPAHILSKFNGGAAAAGLTPQKFASAYLKELGKTIPMEAGTEAFQEAVNIAAERYNNGDDPMPTAADFKRLREAAVGGAAGGFLGAPMAAYGETRQADTATDTAERTAPAELAQPIPDESDTGDVDVDTEADTRTPKQAMKDGARKAAMLVQEDPAKAAARAVELAESDELTDEEQGELDVLTLRFQKPAQQSVAPAPIQSPAAVAPAAPTSGGASPESTPIRKDESKLSVDGTQPSAATPSVPLVKPPSPEEQVAELIRTKNRQPGRLEAIARRFPQTTPEVAELLKQHPTVGSDAASVREYEAKVNAVEERALRAREATRTEQQAKKESAKAEKLWDKRETVDTWQTLNATPNLDDAGQAQLGVMAGAVDRWKARAAELAAKDKLTVGEAQEARVLQKRLKRYALPEKLTPAPGNTAPAVVKDSFTTEIPVQGTAPTASQETPTVPAEPAPPPAAAPMFGEVGSSTFYDNETFAGVKPDQLASVLGGTAEDGASPMAGRMDDKGDRTKTRISLVLEGPNGEVIERGLYKPQDIKHGVVSVAGAREAAPAVQGIARKIGGKKQVVLESKDGKRANPMLVSDLVAAGWKPIARIAYTGEPGVISNNFANRAHFEASFAAAKKAPAQQTKGALSTHIISTGDNALAVAESQQEGARMGKVNNAQTAAAIAAKQAVDAQIEAQKGQVVKAKLAEVDDAFRQQVADVIGEKRLASLRSKAEGLKVAQVLRLLSNERDTNAKFNQLAIDDGRTILAAKQLVLPNAKTAGRVRDAGSSSDSGSAGKRKRAKSDAGAGDRGAVGGVSALGKALSFTPKQAHKFYEFVAATSPDGLITEKALRKLPDKLQSVLGDAAVRYGEDWEKFASAIQSAYTAADDADAFAESLTDSDVLNAPPLDRHGNVSGDGRAKTDSEGNARGRGSPEGEVRLSAAAASILGGSDRAISPPARGQRETPADARQRSAHNRSVRQAQAAKLRAWAQSKGLLHDDAAFTRAWTECGELGGQESDVYPDKKRGAWIKRTNIEAAYTDYLDYLQSIELANELFPEAPINLIGFVDHDGQLMPLVEQRDIKGRGARRDEVIAWMQERGWEHTGGDSYRRGSIIAEDLHDENVLIDDATGMPVVIDASFVLDTRNHYSAPPVTTASGRTMPMGLRTGTDLLLYGADMPLPAAARSIITTLADNHSAILSDVKVMLGAERESYDPATNTISVSDDSAPERVLEEVVHAITVRKWRSAVEAYGPELTDAPAAFRDLAAVYQTARAALGQQQTATPDQAFAAAGITGYRLASMEEFLAGVLTDQEFQATLAATPAGNTTLWTRVLNAIRNLLGLAPHTTSLLDAAFRATGKFAEADPISERIAEKRTYLGTPTEVAAAFTATEHIPAEYLDPITGQMRNPTVLPDSPAAAAWNLLFAPPAEDRSTYTESIAKNDVAANRDYDATLQAAWKANARNGESLEQFQRAIGGKALPSKTIESIVGRVPTARDAKLGSLDQHEDRATRNAYSFQRNAQFAANKAAIRYQQEAEKSGDALVDKVKKAAEVEKRFRDAEYMESTMRAKLHDLVRDLAAGIQRGPTAAFAAGRLAGAIRAIEGLAPDAAIPDQYQQVFKQVLDGNVSVFDYLQAMAKLPVDFKAGPRAIAQAIEENATTSPTLAALAKNKPMKAALATLAATQSKEMNLLALRVLRDQAEYLATMSDMEQIRSASASQLEQIAKTIPAYGEARSLRDRIKAEHVAQRREMAALQKRVIGAEANAERAHKAAAMFGARAKELEKIVGAFSDWQPIHGATYFAMTRQKDGTWISTKRTLEMIGETHSEQVAKDVAINQRWLAQTKDELGGTRHWNEVKRQTEAIFMADVLRKKQASHRFWFDRFLQPAAEKFESTGTQLGQQIGRRLRKYQFIVKTNGSRTEALAHRWDHAMQAAAKAAGYDHHLTFFKEVYDHVLYAIESEPGIANDEGRVMRLAAKVAREYAGDRKMTPDFPQKLAAVLRETKAISEHFIKIAEEHGLYVEDAKLTDPLGAKHNLLRHAIRYGWLTGPRKLRASTLQNTVNRMTSLGWKAVKGEHTFEIEDEATGKPRTMTMDEAMPLFTSDVIDLFVTPFATKPGAPIFEGAIGADKERAMIDQDLVGSIWRESQGVADFAERLFNATGGTQYGDKLEDFSANLLESFDKMYHMTTATAAMTSAAKNLHNPQGPRPHRIMDSRTNDLLPPEFFEYETFDPASARAFLGELAYHAAFGRDAKGLDADLDGMTEDLKLKAQSAKLLKEDYSKRERAAAAKRLGIDLRGAERAQRTLADMQAWASQMHLHFSAGKQTGALGDSKAILEAVNLNMMLVLNQPKSGLWNLMSVADFPLLFRGLGKTSRAAVAGSLKNLMKGAVGSGLETFGCHMLHATEEEQILGELVHGRSTAQLPLSVGLSDMGKHGEFDEGGAGNKVAQFSRKVQGLMRKEVKFGGAGEFAGGADALWAPFRYLNNLAAHSLAVSNVRQVEAMIAQAMKFYESNPDAFNSPTHRLTAADLGMGGKGFFGDEGAYEFYRNRLSEYGLGSIEQMAREAMGRQGAGARVLSREQVQMVGLMALNEISMESSVNTRPIEMFNNPVLNVGMKLLGWPIAKMNQVHKAMKTGEGQIEARALMQTLAVMALWSLPVGIAASLAMDDYDDKITGKKSNLRSIDGLAAVPILGPLAFFGEGGGSNILAALERGARAGNVYGMGADFANSLTNVLDPKSGQRDFSLDSRVLVMSQFANFRDMVRNLINQDGTVTYASVGRPFLSSLGGNGAIQYLQIWNNMTGADNAEARVTARISSQNWLRAAGREIGLELRGGEGRSSPTPLSVQVREMQLAAYAGDRIGFLEAYRAAVEAARKEAPANAKPGEAEARVLASWKGRNPLTSTFRSKPTEMQVFQLLNAMDDSGRAAVQGALSAYNQFTEMIAPVKMTGMAMPRAPQMPKAPK